MSDPGIKLKINQKDNDNLIILTKNNRNYKNYLMLVIHLLNFNSWNWLIDANTLPLFYLKWMGDERPNGNYLERIKYEAWLRKNAAHQRLFWHQSLGGIWFF